MKSWKTDILEPIGQPITVCQVDVVRTDYEGKAEEYKEPEVPEPVLEVVTSLPEVEVIQKKDPPPIPPPPVTEARLKSFKNIQSASV